ncbi:MAG: serine/threonine-protein kinase [Kofleriaceae bacterium]
MSDHDTVGDVPGTDGLIALPAPGYDLGEMIGRGGMGEVLRAHDRRIDREIAIKRMRTAPNPGAVARFLREARIQARLDHPAIVPVHDIGVDDQGRPFFTMKQITGTTLAKRLEEGYARNRLLRAFVDVCQAIAYAHERGIVHRDLKPANIMLGDYGEVYVLDWGIARVLDGAPEPASAPTGEAIDTATRAGDVLGTPGFMAPEQVRGEAAGPASDVYALGAILFEILTLEELHPRGPAAFETTLGKPQQSPQARVPDERIAPELDAACFAALAEASSERPTARQLAERIQRYVDGDRDLERRHQLALSELAIARTAFEAKDPEEHAHAIQAAGRALALEPKNLEAAAIIASLALEPSGEQPKELVAELAQQESDYGRRHARTTAAAVASVLALGLVTPFMEIRNWTTWAIVVVSLAAASASILVIARKRYLPAPFVLIVAGVVAVAVSRIAGVFMLTPVIIAGSVEAICGNKWVRDRRLVIYGWLALVTFAPLVLERFGVFHPSVTLDANGLCTLSPVFRGRGTIDAVILLGANFALLITLANFAIATNRQIALARDELRAQAWHLEQLLPTKIR